jgi:uncharacterized protein (TIGR02145 family)
MKKSLSTIIFLIVALGGIYAQNITIRFTGRSQDNAYMRLDSIVVHNNSQNWERTIIYPDTTMTIILNGIYEHKNADFSLAQNTPNPFDGKTEVELTNPEAGHTALFINDINGKLIAQFGNYLSAGTHKFEINLSTPQTYILSASINGKTSSIKMINTGKGNSNSISYLGQTLQQKLTVNDFELGDVLKYTGYATFEGVSVSSTPIAQMQNGSEDITLTFPINIMGTEENPVVNTLLASTISCNSATLNGYATCNCNIQSVGFIYGSSPNNLQYRTTTTLNANGNFSKSVSGLASNTMYYYRAFATTQTETFTGELCNFTTPEDNEPHDITVIFTGRGNSTFNYYFYWNLNLDSVKVENQTRNWEHTLLFPDTVLNIDLQGNTKLNISGNASSNDRMLYTGYTSYRGVVYTQQIQRYLNTETVLFTFPIPLCDDKYIHIEINDCEPVTYNGITYTQSGQYEIGHYQTVQNCDSIVILDIYISNQIFNEIEITTCDNSYTLNGTTYTESGTYQQTFTSVHGCDSLVSLNLSLGNGFTDERDGNSYCTITYGNQVWMAENLRYMPVVNRCSDYTNYESRYYVYGYNGTDLDEAKSLYNYLEYGTIYNYIAAQTACPSGWHLPTDAEWTELEIYLQNTGHNFDGYVDNDNDRETHNVIAKALASQTNWMVSDIVNAPGWLQQKNNSSGFNGKPAGWVFRGESLWINEQAGWWANTLNTNGNGWDRYLHFSRTHVTRSHNNMSTAMSVRCVQDID